MSCERPVVAGIGIPPVACAALLREDLLNPDRAAERFHAEFAGLAAATLSTSFTVLHILSDSHDALLQGLVSHK